MKCSRDFIIKLIFIIVIASATSLWAYNYFSTKVFYIDDHKYSEKPTESDRQTRYMAWSGEPIWITQYPDYKQLQVNGEVYRLKELESTEYKRVYQVIYPNGNSYTVEDVNNSGFLMAYDKKGELFIELQVYSNHGSILAQGEKFYHPSSLVTAAYDHYHQHQGNVFIFTLSIACFIYCWYVYRKESFQRFLFKISYGVWVVDPEPSDMYFFAMRISAIAVMVMSGLFVLYSLK